MDFDPKFVTAFAESIDDGPFPMWEIEVSDNNSRRVYTFRAKSASDAETKATLLFCDEMESLSSLTPEA
jgi:hypothetical protein